MRTGIATVPLDYGKCPPWLFRRMERLSRSISSAIIEEFGTEELLKRLADPVWFQSLGCVIGFDWNSSGLTTTTLGAIKSGLRGRQKELGIFICGGKGKTSKKTPQDIQEWGEFLGFSVEKVDSLVYASKMSAKVDNTALQDGFQLYHHNLIFNNKGFWTVVQQGMSGASQKARRYHWFSGHLHDFVEEPHSGIISQSLVKPLNLTAKESGRNKEINVAQVREEPKAFLKNLGLIQRKEQSVLTIMELKNVEFNRHPVVEEKFDLKRLNKTVALAHSCQPQNFEQLISIKGVGPRTIRALSLVSELIYGAKPSYEDPARYSFAHGGKDGTPFPVDREAYDKTLEVMERAIQKSPISLKEKLEARRRLNKTINGA